MKKKKNWLIILVLLIGARIIVTFWEKDESMSSSSNNSIQITSSDNLEPINSDATLSKTPDEAVTSLHSETNDNTCQLLRTRYQNLEEVRKTNKASMRFFNIHKKIDGTVYRTRFFYKDSEEKEIPTYLVYKEDQNEVDHLIENSKYKKGPLYKDVEKKEGTIIYTEEGVNIGEDQDLFLHYENKELKDLQGTNHTSEKKDFIECRY